MPTAASIQGPASFFDRRKAPLKHFYSDSANIRENVNRGIELLSPVWNIFDLTHEGRGDWNAKLEYN